MLQQNLKNKWGQYDVILYINKPPNVGGFQIVYKQTENFVGMILILFPKRLWVDCVHSMWNI